MVASPRPRLGTFTMRSKARSWAGFAVTRKISQGVADLGPLVEARAADHPVGQPEL